MPFYRWRGVRLDASWVKGVQFARNEQILEQQLLRQEIALLSCAPKKYVHLLPISAEEIYMLLQQLQALTAAGIHIWQALRIVSEQMSDPRLARTADSVGQQIEAGKTLHEACERYPNVFTPLMIHVAQVGVHADNLPTALDVLCHYLGTMDRFKKKIRSALLLPLVTIMLFIAMLGVVLFVIVPQYSTLFSSFSHELPTATRTLLSIRAFVASWYMVGTLIIVTTAVMIVHRLFKQVAFAKRIDAYLIQIPLIQHICQVHFLSSLHLLLQGGMSLVPALQIAHQVTGNSYFKQELAQVILELQAGHTFTDALQVRASLIGQDVVQLMSVGQESGQLTRMIEHAALAYRKKVERRLQQLVTGIQPVVMIILGLLIAGLIYAVYVPLFNLADVL